MLKASRVDLAMACGGPALDLEAERWTLIECCLEAGEQRLGQHFPREVYRDVLSCADLDQIQAVLVSFLDESEALN